MAGIDKQDDQLNYIRSEIREEIALLNNRLNSLMSSQSFLVIAYASTLSSNNGDFHSLFTIVLPPFLAILGAALVLEARPSLKAALEAIDNWRQREAQLVSSSADYAPYTLAVDDRSRQAIMRRQHQGRHFATRAPVIMLVAWLVLLLLPFGLFVAG
tara:strand:- start:3774 stop:4244 length:471 start_codon:yes stop_codon:yes gene_type:complete